MTALPPLSQLLGLPPAPPALTPDERLYMQGFLQGYALRPDGVPELPASAPIAPERRLYLNGLLAGLLSRTGAPPARPAVTILYASQTGTAEGIAAEAARRLGANARAMDDASPTTLSGTVLFFASTFGDGDPPDNGANFWRALSAPAAPRLEALRYGVLAFGDSSYAQFCGFGAKLEARLRELGAQPLLERQNCEPDDDATPQAWLARAEASLGATAAPAAPPATPAGYSRQHPFMARLTGNTRLNAPGSGKETRHFVFDLGESGLSYEAGDALGVWPRNDPAVLDEMARLTGLPPDTLAGRDITRITPPLLAFCLAHSPALGAALAGQDEAARRDWLWGRHLADLLRAFPLDAPPEAWLGALKPLAPRLYSISSSPKAHPGEAHLTVNILRYEHEGRQSGGLCSRFLADRAAEAGIFIQPSGHFRLPADDSLPVIMIGPGTGIAPFRAFLEDRKARGATGRNWLVFGEQREASDFYYRDELDALAREGFLHRLSTAFSRDQARKIYVQDRLREAGAELWSWLQEGAHLYICGDASRMAKDVDAALRDIAARHGGMEAEAAAAYLGELAAQKRYLRDVY